MPRVMTLVVPHAFWLRVLPGPSANETKMNAVFHQYYLYYVVSDEHGKFYSVYSSYRYNADKEEAKDEMPDMVSKPVLFGTDSFAIYSFIPFFV